MHHKRRRPKNRRAGCLLCKPHKANGAKDREAYERVRDRRTLCAARYDLADLGVRGADGFKARIHAGVPPVEG